MFNVFKKSLSKTLDAIKTVVPEKKVKISKDLLEEILLEADVDYELIEEIIYYLPPQDEFRKEDIKRVLKAYFIYDKPAIKPNLENPPLVELILGINGAGKTTTIAKLANAYKKEGKSVILGASDTFRAAAIEQLKRWAAKIDVPIIYTAQGHDPSAVAYDTINSAKAKKFSNAIIDTAGRLHNQVNLANELKKIVKICEKAHQSLPPRKILILDATLGNSSINQAVEFNKIVGIDEIIITKLDGTAKGGAIFSIARNLQIPIAYIGVGEGVDDLVKFDADEYIESLLDGIFVNNGKN